MRRANPRAEAGRIAKSSNFGSELRNSPGVAGTTPRRMLGWGLGVAALAVLCLLSLAVGAKDIPLATVGDALFAFDDSDDHVIVTQLRLPRTVLAIIVGMALGICGALMQAITRNPLADPGILGVNAGAAFAVAVAVGIVGVNGLFGTIWFAFAGAAAATIAVYTIGSLEKGGATPIGLTLAGVAVGAVLSGVTAALVLLDPIAFDQMRDWNAGSLAGRGFDVVVAVAPFAAVGLVLAFALARPLNSIALGDDLALALGVRVRTVRTIGVIAVTLLCGAATAAAGPIGFVGLMIPHIARWVVGPDQRWVMAYTIVWAPALVLAADILGRVLIRPAEMPVGVVTAFLGAPVLIYLVRRLKAVNA